MTKTVIFTDDIRNYLNEDLVSEREVKHAVAKTYSKSWSLISGVDGTCTTIGTKTVDFNILPYPDFKFGDFKVTRVDVTSKRGILLITFT